MTKEEEILAMEAGRELDALVSEKIMGVKCGVTLADGELEPVAMDWSKVPNYSTDISAAWPVVGKMINNGYGFRLDYCTDDYLCLFFKPPTRAYGCGVKVPEAICKAALIAKIL